MSTSDSQRAEGYSEPISPAYQDTEVHRWTPRREHYAVVDESGVQEEHSGIGLTLRHVVRHLCRDDWPAAYSGSDLVVFKNGRARALIAYARPGESPTAYRLWSQVDGRDRMGQPIPYMGDATEDELDD